MTRRRRCSSTASPGERPRGRGRCGTRAAASAPPGAAPGALARPLRAAQLCIRRTLANNMVVGVSTGFTKTMEMIGTGYRASMAGKELTLNVGYSNPRVLPIPEGIKVTVSPRAALGRGDAGARGAAFARRRGGLGLGAGGGTSSRARARGQGPQRLPARSPQPPRRVVTATSLGRGTDGAEPRRAGSARPGRRSGRPRPRHRSRRRRAVPPARHRSRRRRATSALQPGSHTATQPDS
jgi:hypothetical protein